MIVKNIFYGVNFEKQFLNLPKEIQKLAIKKEKIFRNNPIHPYLRLYQLKGKLIGLWSISITLNYRLIFQREDNGDIIFVSIGKHEIYKYL